MGRNSKRLKEALRIHHWRNLVADISLIGTIELQKRLRPISYLRKKEIEAEKRQNQFIHGKDGSHSQLNLFDES